MSIGDFGVSGDVSEVFMGQETGDRIGAPHNMHGYLVVLAVTQGRLETLFDA